MPEDVSLEETPFAEEAVEATASKPAKKRKKKWIVLGSIVAVIAVLGIGFLVWHNQPSFCANPLCHDTMGSYLAGYEDSDYLVHAHAEAGVKCLDCHIPTLKEQITEFMIQVKGTYRLPLAKMKVDDEFCLRDGCHDRETIAKKSVEAGGTIAFPHVMKVDDSAAQMQNPHGTDGEALPCSTCHTSHRKSAGIQYCFDACHHPGTFEKCSDCHTKGTVAGG